MIVLSLVLVIVAAVALIAGFFQQDSLTLIWVSIGACVTAMLFLGVGVLQRKRTTPATEGGYGSGSEGGPIRPSGSAAPSRPASRDRDREAEGAPEGAPPSDERAAADAPQPVAASVGTDTDGDVDDEDATTVIVRKASARGGTKKAVVKKATAKAPGEQAPPEEAATKKSATKKAGKKAATKKAAKKSAARKATTGAAARAVLADIPGVGPAKQEALLEAFGSIEDLRAAGPDEIASVRGVGPALAQRIHSHLG